MRTADYLGVVNNENEGLPNGVFRTGGQVIFKNKYSNRYEEDWCAITVVRVEVPVVGFKDIYITSKTMVCLEADLEISNVTAHEGYCNLGDEIIRAVQEWEELLAMWKQIPRGGTAAEDEPVDNNVPSVVL